VVRLVKEVEKSGILRGFLRCGSYMSVWVCVCSVRVW